MSWEGGKLRDLLAKGWEVKGFQSDFSMSETSGKTLGRTSGASILLQKGSDLAIATTSFDARTGKGHLSVEIITEDR
ncbi:MAG: hypothetical protein Q8L54_01560 [Devosia sp.]|nr:hypothetical protein [Devosia sp.]